MDRTVLKKLPNGVRVAVVDTPGMMGAIIEVFVQIGSKYESLEEFGMSHFMEHMSFKGTHKRPVPSLIFKEMDSRGVSYNAGTGLEATSYYVKCLPRQLVWASEILSDLLLDPLFEQKELDKERGVVLEEIAMYQDNPMMGLANDFAMKYLKSGSRGCWNVIGTRESLLGIDSKKMHEFRAKLFDPSRVVLVVAGDKKQYLSQMDEVLQPWASWKGKNLPLPEIKVEQASFNEQVEKQLDQAHFCIGWSAVDRKSPERYQAKVVDLLLCGNFSARLVSLLREELGVAYYVHSAGETLGELGYMAVQAGVSKSRLEEVMELTKKEIVGLGKWLDEEKFKNIVDYLVGVTQLQMDKVTFWSDFIGQKLILDGELDDLELELDKYRNLPYESVVDFCKKYLEKGQMSSLVVTGKK